MTITLAFITSRVSLFPNPGKVKWQLVDNAGRIVSHNTIIAKKGNIGVVINLNRLSAGTYFLIVSGRILIKKLSWEIYSELHIP